MPEILDGEAAPALSAKLDRVEVGVLQHEAQPDRPAGQSAEVASALPRHRAVDLVADDRYRFGEGATRYGPTGRVLDLDAHAPAAEVEQLSTSCRPENVSGRVNSSPPAWEARTEAKPSSRSASRSM